MLTGAESHLAAVCETSCCQDLQHLLSSFFLFFFAVVGNINMLLGSSTLFHYCEVHILRPPAKPYH